MDLERLKRETEPDHVRTEETMNVMSPDLDRTAYIATLQKLYGFIKGWELWTEQVSATELKQHLCARHRSPLLAADLAFFSAALPDTIYPGPCLSPDNPAEVLGAMYVVEGSTLGGRYIARHVEQVLSLAPNAGNSYFRGYGEETGQMWNEVKALLRNVPDRDAPVVARSAKLLFADFASWNVNFDGDVYSRSSPQGRMNV